MASRPIQCAECDTLLYNPCSDAGAGPVDFGNPVRLTVEQMVITDIVCFSATCPSHSKVVDLGPLEDTKQVSEQPSEQRFEQAEIFTGTGTNTDTVGQQAHRNNAYLGSQQQQPLTPQGQQQLAYNVLTEGVNDIRVAQMPKAPCRLCYQVGNYCHWDPNEEDCSQCRARVRKTRCDKSLLHANPGGHWARSIENGPIEAVVACAMKPRTPNSRAQLRYCVKWASKHRNMWTPARNLKEYPGVLKGFHLANPHSAGPPFWLVDGDREFAGLLAAARLREGQV